MKALKKTEALLLQIVQKMSWNFEGHLLIGYTSQTQNW